MKRKAACFGGMVGSLVLLIGFGSCDFVMGPDKPAAGQGNLIISLGAGAERAVSSGAALPDSVLTVLRYELTLAGPGTALLKRTVTGMETLSMMIALGDWHVTVEAYQEDGLAGTGSLSFTVGPGQNPVRVPMYINGGYFDIAAGASMSNGTVTADFTAAFPKTTITLTAAPEAGYVLKAGTVTYNDGSDHTIAGPPYTFTMPAADVTVRAEFTLCSVGGTITTNKPGGPASGASVQLKRGGTTVGGPVSTDGSGAYTIPHVPAGTGYTIEVSLGGYVTGTSASFDVTTAEVTGRDLTLVKIPAAGDITAYTGDGYTGESISFKMAYVPGGLNFPTGLTDGPSATVAAAFEIGETEVTYELWYTVMLWGVTHGYTFHNISTGGYPSTPEGRQEPVTVITWFDAVVWLNALTEWVNAKTGSGLTPVYYYYDSAYTTVAKDSTPTSNFVKENGSYAHASAYAKPGATGFRLPASDEWELAARWRGSDPTNTVSGYADPYFTKGDSASGATASHTNVTATGAVAWYDGNASGKAQPVKGKAANALGLYDMSGNVLEWCFDWYPGLEGNDRIFRGGDWYDGTAALQVGGASPKSADNRNNTIGFRPARTIE